MVVAKVRVKIKVQRRRIEREEKADLDKLEDEDMARRYSIAVANRFQQLQDESSSWEQVCSIVKDTAMEVLGPMRKKKRNEWYDEECRHVGELRKKLREEWLENYDDEIKRDRHREAKRLVKRTHRRKKRQALRRTLMDIESDIQNKRVRNQFQKVKEVRKGYQPRMETVKNKEGNLLTNEEQVTQRWRQHYQELLNQPEPERPVEETVGVEEQAVDAIEEPSMEEIERVLRVLKNHKSGGEDGISAELVDVWRREVIPREWETAVIISLHKKEDRTICNNYRGLSLLSVGYKILAKILYLRLLPYYEDIVGPYQTGFMKNRSTIDNIFVLRQTGEKYWEYGKEMWHIFIDFA